MTKTKTSITVGMAFRSLVQSGNAGLYKVLAADVDKNTVRVRNSNWDEGVSEYWYYDVLLEALNSKEQDRFILTTEEFPITIKVAWIPVEDELPTPSIKPNLNKVLIYSSVIGIGTGYYWGEGDKKNDPLKGWCTVGVTHWMPLISPPQHIKK